MRFDERRPRRLSFPVRRGFDSVLLENVANGRVGDMVADVGQRALDSVVASGRVFLSETKDQVDNHLTYPRATRLPTLPI